MLDRRAETCDPSRFDGGETPRERTCCREFWNGVRAESSVSGSFEISLVGMLPNFPFVLPCSKVDSRSLALKATFTIKRLT